MQIASVQNDLGQFSSVQMSNFIAGIKDKQRQREVMVQASLKEQALLEGSKAQSLSGVNLRQIY